MPRRASTGCPTACATPTARSPALGRSAAASRPTSASWPPTCLTSAPSRQRRSARARARPARHRVQRRVLRRRRPARLRDRHSARGRDGSPAEPAARSRSVWSRCSSSPAGGLLLASKLGGGANAQSPNRARPSRRQRSTGPDSARHSSRHRSPLLSSRSASSTPTAMAANATMSARHSMATTRLIGRPTGTASPNFGNLKPGMGVLIDLGAERDVANVKVDFLIPGATVEARVGSSDPGASSPTDANDSKLLNRSSRSAPPVRRSRAPLGVPDRRDHAVRADLGHVAARRQAIIRADQTRTCSASDEVSVCEQ